MEKLLHVGLSNAAVSFVLALTVAGAAVIVRAPPGRGPRAVAPGPPQALHAAPGLFAMAAKLVRVGGAGFGSSHRRSRPA